MSMREDIGYRMDQMLRLSTDPDPGIQLVNHNCYYYTLVIHPAALQKVRLSKGNDHLLHPKNIEQF